MKTLFAFACICLVVMPGFGFAAAGQTRSAVNVQASGTKAAVLALADKYIKEATTQLTAEDAQTIDSFKSRLQAEQKQPTILAMTVNDSVSSLTIGLANMNSLPTVLVCSASLVKAAPDNARATNLFGTVLHSIGELKDAVSVMEYTSKLDAKSTLIMLNMANAYLDINQVQMAKAFIDKVITLNPNNKSAYSALANYWYKKGDMKQTLNAMMKAASFGGWVQKATAKNTKTTAEIERNEEQAGDNIAVLDADTDAVKDLKPATTADLIESEYPDVAQKIRDQYGRLMDNERMVLPKLPTINTSTLKDFKETGMPYVREWTDAFNAHSERGLQDVSRAQADVNPTDSESVVDQKARIAADKQVKDALAQAQKMIDQMQNMPGMTQRDVREARKAMQQAMKDQGIKPTSASGDESADSEKDDNGELADNASMGIIPGFDSGSPLAQSNYVDYLRVRNSYDKYFLRYYKDFNKKVTEILNVYNLKVAEETKVNIANIKPINEEEEKAREESKKLDGVFDDRKFVLRRLKEDLRHRKALNTMGDNYFKQWVNLYMPEYVQKMKPKLQNYWGVCALYVRNMNDPAVMKREYLHIKQGFWTNASMAVGQIAVGDSFTYVGDTDEEEAQVNELTKLAEEDAQAKKPEYEAETQEEKNAIEKWLDDNVAFGIAGELLSLKITPRKITVEEYIAGMNFKHVYDFKDQKWTTYRSFCAKIDFGIQVGPMKAKVSARADILESHDTIDFKSGSISGGSQFAKGQVGISGGMGNLGVNGGAQVTIDPALNSEVHGRLTGGVSVKSGNFSVKPL